jgi:hypothetical protein
LYHHTTNQTNLCDLALLTISICYELVFVILWYSFKGYRPNQTVSHIFFLLLSLSLPLLLFVYAIRLTIQLVLLPFEECDALLRLDFYLVSLIYLSPFYIFYLFYIPKN